jgi:hypothetical protein
MHEMCFVSVDERAEREENIWVCRKNMIQYTK